MKKINKLIALLIVCMAMPALAGAQVLKNAYFNVDWQINSPFGQDFSKKTSGWGAHAEGGYYVIPNFAIGAFISYHTNNEYVDRQTIPVNSTSVILPLISRATHTFALCWRKVPDNSRRSG